MHVIDWLVMFVPLAIVAVIAVKTYGYTRSVADFMVANRIAGRYLLANAQGEAGGGLTGQVAVFQVIFVAGFAMSWWSKLSMPVSLLIALTGFVAYRYRQARVMTLAQFFEIRYSKRFRIFSGALSFTSGVVNFGIFPATGAYFFVYFCGLPPLLHAAGHAIPTFAVLMAIFLSITVFLTISGGWLTVMVVDCIEGLISGLLYMVVIIVLLRMFGWSQITEAMAAAPPGKSMLNPMDTMQTRDFNLWYVLIGIVASIYSVGSWQGGAAFRGAAASPHEAKMAGILGSWRNYAKGLMFTLLAICSYTYLNHVDFAAPAHSALEYLKTIDNPQIRDQMRVPVALSYLLPVGIKGVLAAIMLFAMVAADGSYMHSWGGILIQDVILPFRKKPFEPKQHILLLRLAIIGVALFGFFFSLFYEPTQYILMFFALTGAIFSGAGAAIIGGLYWKRGTTPAAWASLITGSTIGVSAIILQQGRVWPGYVAPWLQQCFPDSVYLQEHLAKFPINGQWMMLVAQLSAVTIYVVVSLLTCRKSFNLDRMLHRGPYAVEAKPGDAPTAKPKFTWGMLIGFDREFTLGDKINAGSLFAWNMLLLAIFIVCTIWNLIAPWPLQWWANYWHVILIIVPLTLGVITTGWFTWGGIRDLKRAFQALKTVKRDARDDGMVVNHHNLDEPNSEPTAAGNASPAMGTVRQARLEEDAKQ